ncbi:MAG: DegT/DnrJ/EryC1/StrS family aminotransferase [Clostridia bacterium]|nr:DegT/DnrJ/EryC1/StrS family aminotransferase [Clostridia bacterium]
MKQFFPEKRILLATPTMHGDEMGFVKEAFDRNWVAPLGFNCDAFESEMCEYLRTERDASAMHALSLVSGTAGLHLAVKLAGVKRGDIVLCSDMTFAASVNPVVYEGGVPVFVDAERDTWNMDPEALALAFRKYPQAKVVVLVHLYGTPAKMDAITEICKKHGAILIEDAAEALGATYHGKACGTFGAYNAISFNGNKIITTSGGGMLLTETKEARDKAFFWATQSREPAPWYQHEEIGYNYRMSNVLAGIGRGQLLHLSEHRDAKERIYRRYAEGLRGLPLSMNPYEVETCPNFWLSCLLLSEGAPVSAMEIFRALNEKNIETRPIWKPMHLQPVFDGCDFVSASDTSVCEDIFARGLCLPSDIKMTDEEQDYVIGAIRACF